MKLNLFQHRHSTGFTLMEILVAIGIFAIGMVGIASLFPPALLLQKQTFEAAEEQMFIDNTIALIQAAPFDSTGIIAQNTAAPPAAPLNNPIDTSGRITPIPEVLWDANSANRNEPYAQRWGIEMRSGPSNLPVTQRDLFWFPLFLDTDITAGQSWKTWIFVMRRPADTNDTSSVARLWDTTYTKLLIIDGSPCIWATDPLIDPANDEESLDIDNDGFNESYPSIVYIPITPINGGRFNFINSINGTLAVRVGQKILLDSSANPTESQPATVIDADAFGITVSLANNNFHGFWCAWPRNDGTPSFVALEEVQNGVR